MCLWCPPASTIYVSIKKTQVLLGHYQIVGMSINRLIKRLLEATVYKSRAKRHIYLIFERD